MRCDAWGVNRTNHESGWRAATHPDKPLGNRQAKDLMG